MRFEMHLTYRYEVPDADLEALYGTRDPSEAAKVAADDPIAVVAFFPGDIISSTVKPATGDPWTSILARQDEAP